MSLFSRSKCKCHAKEVRITGWSTDNYFKSMRKVGSRDDGWRNILKCETCGQYWLVDEYDKAQYLYAIKIDNPNDITDRKLLEIHKFFLENAHNGISSQTCQMAGCNNNAVNDFAFCAECLITKLGIYE